MKRRLIAFVLALALAAVAFAPRPVRASDTITQSLIIGGAITGTVVAVMLIAILAADRNEPDFFTLGPTPASHRTTPPSGRVRSGANCPPTAVGPALLCW